MIFSDLNISNIGDLNARRAHLNRLTSTSPTLEMRSLAGLEISNVGDPAAARGVCINIPGVGSPLIH